MNWPHWIAGHGKDFEAGTFRARCRPCGKAWFITISGGLRPITDRETLERTLASGKRFDRVNP